MSNVINKTTLQYLRSVHTPYYKTGWIINPVLPECDFIYWKVASGVVKEMTASEKTVKDTELAAQTMDAQKEQLIQTKIREIGIQALKDDDVLDSSGDIIGG